MVVGVDVALDNDNGSSATMATRIGPAFENKYLDRSPRRQRARRAAAQSQIASVSSVPRRPGQGSRVVLLKSERPPADAA
jgi:hypothetical protein